MAKLLNLSWLEAISVGVGMCGRAEMAFILAGLGLSLGFIDQFVFFNCDLHSLLAQYSDVNWFEDLCAFT